jgi:hypothetical protein
MEEFFFLRVFFRSLFAIVLLKRNGLSVAFWHFEAATLCRFSQPKWGSDGDVLDKGLCLQQWRMEINGEEFCKSFRNGDRERG